MPVFCVVLILYFLSGAETQSLTANIEVSSGCTKGLRHNRDYFTLTGKANSSGVDITNRTIITVYLSAGSVNVYSPTCTIHLDACRTEHTPCDCMSSGPQTFDIKYSPPDSISYDSLDLKFVWTDGQNNLTESPIVSVGSIYYGPAVNILTVNGVSVNLTETPCTLSFTRGNNHISLCTANAPSSRVSAIIHNDDIVSGNPCANITVSGNTFGNFRFSSSVCGDNASDAFECEHRLDLGEVLELSVTVFETSCDVGLIATTDYFVLNATVYADSDIRALFIDFIKLVITAETTIVACSVDIRNCSDVPMNGCHCIMDTGETAVLYMRLPARSEYSSALTYLHWTALDPSRAPQLSNSLMLPMISDATFVDHSLTVRGCDERQVNELCTTVVDNIIGIDICCPSDVKPCTIWLKFRDTEVAHGRSCLFYTFTAEEEMTIDVSAILSLCDVNRTDGRMHFTIEVRRDYIVWFWWGSFLGLCGCIVLLSCVVGNFMWSRTIVHTPRVTESTRVVQESIIPVDLSEHSSLQPSADKSTKFSKETASGETAV